MKKILLIGLIAGLALVLVGGVGVVYAMFRGSNAVITQTTTLNGQQIVRQYSTGRGGRGEGFGPGGMMGGDGYEYGPGGMMGGNGYGYGPGGMMGGNGFGPGGMMGGRGYRVERNAGPMHEYMIKAFADAVGLTVDEVNTRLNNGDSLGKIAKDQGFTGDKLTTLVTQVRKAALDAAVKDGLLTQSQADTMLQHMDNFTGNGFDGCPMWDNDEVQP